MQGWRGTKALGRAVLITGLLAIGAVVLGRVDLVVLAAPFALGTAFALRRRPDAGPGLEVAATEQAVEGGALVGVVSAANPAPADLDVVVLRLAVSRWLALDGAERPQAVAVPAGRAADLELAGTARRWGRHRLGPVGATAFACDGLLFVHAGLPATAPVKVYPVTEPFSASEAMPRAAGLIGSHRSRRPGEGGELAGVRRYGPGDRLRRVDWRVSLRTRQLHVVSTLSDRDAEVVVLLDLLGEAGRSGGVGGDPIGRERVQPSGARGQAAGTGNNSVLDTTVRAAAAIAEHYLHRGDRVSLMEYGPGARRLRPASGRRQYLTVLEWLLDVRAGIQPEQQQLPLHAVPTNALVVVLTPLVDQRSAPMLARLARAGRFVVAVDTLPADLLPPRQREDTGAAYRLWRLERSNTVEALREHGVPVVAWAGAGSLDQVLRDISRVATAPRVGFS